MTLLFTLNTALISAIIFGTAYKSAELMFKNRYVVAFASGIVGGKYNNFSTFMSMVLSFISVLISLKPVQEISKELSRDSAGYEEASNSGNYGQSGNNDNHFVSSVRDSTNGTNLYFINEITENLDAYDIDTSLEKVSPFVISGYAPGAYRVGSVIDGTAMLVRISQSINYLISKWNVDGSKVNIQIIGQADGIRSTFPIYSGDLGTIEKLAYYRLNEGDSLIHYRDFIPDRTKLGNNEFALLRAFDVWQSLERTLHTKHLDHQLYTNKVSKIGKYQRKVIIVLGIANGLKKNYSNYNLYEKLIFRLCLG